MADSYFELMNLAPDETDDTRLIGRFAASEHTVGPWSDTLMHGGPPSSLAVAMAEQALARTTGRTDLAARRVAIDFVGAVPVADVEVRTRTIRAARSAALVEASLRSGGRECLSARVWFVRESSTENLSDEAAQPADTSVLLGDEAGALGLDFGYGASIDWRYLRGAITEPGPAAVWARPRLPLVAQWTYSGLGAVVLIADSASGVSAELSWTSWSFVNVDLDVHLARPVHGDWILLDATTQLGSAGSALARSTICDEHGVVGAGLQTLVLSRIADP